MTWTVFSRTPGANWMPDHFCDTKAEADKLADETRALQLGLDVEVVKGDQPPA